MRTGLALTAVIALSGLVSLVCTSELATQTAITEATNLAEARAEASARARSRNIARNATRAAVLRESRNATRTVEAELDPLDITLTAEADKRPDPTLTIPLRSSEAWSTVEALIINRHNNTAETREAAQNTAEAIDLIDRARARGFRNITQATLTALQTAEAISAIATIEALR